MSASRLLLGVAVVLFLAAALIAFLVCVNTITVTKPVISVLACVGLACFAGAHHPRVGP